MITVSEGAYMIYEYRCEKCGALHSVWQGMNEVHEYDCCGAKAQRVWTAAPFSIDFKAGFDYGLGQHVETKKQRQRIMDEKGLRMIKC